MATDELGLGELPKQPAGLAQAMVASRSFSAASKSSDCSITLTVQRHLPDGSVMRGKLAFVDPKGRIAISYEQTLLDISTR